MLQRLGAGAAAGIYTYHMRTQSQSHPVRTQGSVGGVTVVIVRNACDLRVERACVSHGSETGTSPPPREPWARKIAEAGLRARLFYARKGVGPRRQTVPPSTSIHCKRCSEAVRHSNRGGRLRQVGGGKAHNSEDKEEEAEHSEPGTGIVAYTYLHY